ncbi:SHOCT domain-containing protein [Mycobacterium sp. CVI_P3]|uniref:SHOCT domain-containing protein n=1 Tax=Mycobacterium pinniadriaticum TaxID=2994102 RepID=A0ABT3SCV8_9MYCO|nr:SHOCT domain-containing protein [Mycobacterium pinniadriaticum]MCX2930895.1 SHOCT domain-containing protein [Mycobacterium pinniadriaticum]MCX2937319.1 SHOCT domain-containing protein [Mycobacterium pinniadriaticum]
MAGAKSVSRVLTVSGILMMLIGGIGFVTVMALNAFVLDDFDAYGEVPIPGSGQLQLPAGQAQISFHTAVTGSPSSGFPMPALRLNIVPPQGVGDPVLTEDHGTLTTINSDTHIRIWTAEIPAAGTYEIRTEGQVNGYINPRLAFGKESDYGYLQWVFAAVFGLGLLDLIMSRVVRGRGGGSVALDAHPPFDFHAPHTAYTPTDQGVRLEQLKTLASLRDSGALTQAEFDAEKRRILGE